MTNESWSTEGVWTTKSVWTTKGTKERESNESRFRAFRVVFVPFVLQVSFVIQTFLAPVTLANGGTIQVASRPAGPYALTVFTSPNPIRVGVVDFSVLVQRAGSESLVQEARVTVTAEPVDRPGTRRSFEATHEQATNRLYHAANVNLPTEGQWRIEVQVSGAEGEGAVSFQVEAVEANLLDKPPMLILVLAVPLLLGVLWLRRSAGRAHSTDGERG